MKKEIFRMEHICVNKKGRSVLEDFKLNIFEGECNAVFGFSGSGIRELGEIFSGRLRPDSGRVLVNEKEISFSEFIISEPSGVFVIDNNTVLLPELTVAENMFFGRVRNILGLKPARKDQEAYASHLLSRFGLDINIRRKGRDLPYYEMLMICLVRAYARNAKLVVLVDPPGLRDIRQGEEIVRILKILKKEGIAILWVCHRLDRIENILDGVFVIRAGKNAGTRYHESFNLRELTSLAENRRTHRETGKMPSEKNGDTVFEIRNLRYREFRELSLSFRKGCITGINANEPEVLAAIRQIMCGEVSEYEGRMRLLGEDYSPCSYEEAVIRGVQQVDVLRYENSVMPRMSVVDNMLLQNYWQQKSLLSPVNKSWHKHVKTQLMQRHRGWKLDRWEDLEPWQQQILILERNLFRPGKIVIVTEPFATFDTDTLNMATDILREMLEMDKTVIILSLNLRNLTEICEEINIIKDREQILHVCADEYKKLL
ncbi:MAG: sugar ABC transporter ATP-binding protein [Parasporobacterium sp.]|nr:sugar ABC transporter ATP-binding protein [Parasporobacterium sp.]